MATLTPSSPEIFALRLTVMMLLERQLEAVAAAGHSAEEERSALLRSTLSGVGSIFVTGGADDGRTDTLRRQVTEEIENIFSGVAQNAAGIDAILDRARTGASIE
jgi:hypothetical protein